MGVIFCKIKKLRFYIQKARNGKLERFIKVGKFFLEKIFLVVYRYSQRKKCRILSRFSLLVEIDFSL